MFFCFQSYISVVITEIKCICLFSLACLACHYILSTRDQTLCESHCNYTSQTRHRSEAYVTGAWCVSEVIHPPTCTARIYDAGPKSWRESGQTVESS